MKAFFLIFLFSASGFSASFHVLVDPGHGGTDSGAVRGKTREADIALKVGEALQQIINGDPELQASLTRTSDQTMTLPERVAKVEKNQADLFLSIHANASTDRRARGVEFYFQNHLPPDEETLFLAAAENRVEKNTGKTENENLSAYLEPTKKNDVLAILEDLKRQHRMSSSLKLSQKLLRSWTADQRGDTNAIRQAPFFVVSKASVPSVLVELGFITNAKEADRLMDPAYQRDIASRIYRGLKDYKEMIDKSEPGLLKSSP